MSDKDIAIKVDGLSKVFRVGTRENIEDSLGKTLFKSLKSPLRNYRKYRSLYKFTNIETTDGLDPDSLPSDIIWAVRNVSFDVERGEVLGIIGRNGAGKSTLLKILTRITPPTHGRVEIHGRVSSLLEVGTGFHQELTGRDNVYLNGTILGMRKHEVDRKFDEIVEFSGVERFLDTPVKRYSSGMRVRLAFAVAAHLEPEVLIIDEVLAVGDAAFQRKCIDKMQDVGREGRTVLFVSHNMPAVTNLCTRTILLDQGSVVYDGNPHDVVGHYLHTGKVIAAEKKWPDTKTAPGGEVARLRAVRIINEDGVTTQSVDMQYPIGLQMEYEVIESGFTLLPHFVLHNDEGVCLFITFDQDQEWRERPRPCGRYVNTAWIPGNFLSEGMFFVNVHVLMRNNNRTQFSVYQAIAFNVLDKMGEGTARGDWGGPIAGVIRPLLKWTTNFDGTETEEKIA